jgi:predicted acyl esterase
MFYQLIIEKDVSIKIRDGSVLCANVFRPADSGQFPVIMTLGPYPKDIHFSKWVPGAYENLPEKGPYMHWETVNPEWWVPQGYVVIRVDTRGSGKSSGRLSVLSRQEAEDFYDAVEWAGTREWSNGKVAVMGVSYFAMNSWRVAALQPPHLAAIVPWEGAADGYRDANRHGGIYSSGFTQAWAKNVSKYQSDKGKDSTNGLPRQDLPPLYPELLTPAQEQNNPKIADIQVPLLSAGNWGGAGLHLRGNVEGYVGAGSKNKYLQIQVGDHVTPFYSLEGRLTQKRFLEQWLKGIDTGITREPPVKLAIRYGHDRYEWRYEKEWPIARTQWTEYYLDASNGTLGTKPPKKEGSASFEADPGAEKKRVTFSTAPFEQDTEITGPINLHLWVSSSIDDADLFVILRKFGPDGKEVTFQGPSPTGSVVAAAYGWLRVSHRKLDPRRSRPYRPYHTHDELQKVRSGEIIPVEIEIWPTCVVFEPEDRLVLEIGSKDDDSTGFYFIHADPRDRVQTGTNLIHTGGSFNSHLLLPIIPRQ